jgi:hypothetical protein
VARHLSGLRELGEIIPTIGWVGDLDSQVVPVRLDHFMNIVCSVISLKGLVDYGKKILIEKNATFVEERLPFSKPRK